MESSDLMNPIGCNSNQLADIMTFCGYDYIITSDEKKLFFVKNKKQSSKRNNKHHSNKRIIKKNNKDKFKGDPNSPFAVLEKLL